MSDESEKLGEISEHLRGIGQSVFMISIALLFMAVHSCLN
jgi:hypothetical protein